MSIKKITLAALAMLGIALATASTMPPAHAAYSGEPVYHSGGNG